MIIVKAGDTHSISWRCNMDLTTATVRVIARLGSEVTVLAAAVTDGPTGTVTHALSGTLPAGSYAVEVEAMVNGRKITFPNDGYETLTVMEDLG